MKKIKAAVVGKYFMQKIRVSLKFFFSNWYLSKKNPRNLSCNVFFLFEFRKVNAPSPQNSQNPQNKKKLKILFLPFVPPILQKLHPSTKFGGLVTEIQGTWTFPLGRRIEKKIKQSASWGSTADPGGRGHSRASTHPPRTSPARHPTPKPAQNRHNVRPARQSGSSQLLVHTPGPRRKRAGRMLRTQRGRFCARAVLTDTLPIPTHSIKMTKKLLCFGKTGPLRQKKKRVSRLLIFEPVGTIHRPLAGLKPHWRFLKGGP